MNTTPLNQRGGSRNNYHERNHYSYKKREGEEVQKLNSNEVRGGKKKNNETVA